MNALLSLWTWFEIGLVALVGFLVQAVLFLLTWPFDRRRLVAGRAFRLVGVLAARLTPFWHFGVVGHPPAGGRPDGGGEQPRVPRRPLPHFPSALGDEVARQGVACFASRWWGG